MDERTIPRVLIARHLLREKLVEDLSRHLFSFLFYDKTSLTFLRKKADKNRCILAPITKAKSRANGFHHEDEPDTLHPHWMFSIENICLYAISCPQCGEYYISNTPNDRRKSCACYDL